MACRLRFLVLVVLVLAGSDVATAQVLRGTPNFGSFGGGQIDAINLANLNSHITIPILHKPGRGLNANFDLMYDSSVWTPVESAGTSSWQPATDWGWNGTAVLFGAVSYTTTTTSTTCSGGNSANTVSYSNWIFSDGKGDHPFAGTSHTYGCTNTTDGFSNVVSTDGAGYTITTNGTTFTLVGRGGTKISAPGVRRGFFGPVAAESLIDRNGNTISVTNGVYTDTLNTTALTVAGTSPNPTTFSYTAPSGSPVPVTVTFKSYTVQTNFRCAGTSEYGPTTNSLVDRVTLPDNSFYSFQYEATPGSPANVTGRLASITLPTGGTITYTYTGGSNGIVCVDGSAAGLTRQTSDGYTTYERTVGTGGASTTTITDPTAQQNQTVINFQGIFETQRQIYQGSASSGTLLETLTTLMTFGTPGVAAYPITARTFQVAIPGWAYACGNYTTFNSVGLPVQVNESACDGTGTVRTTSYSYLAMSNNLNSFWNEVKVTENGLTISDTTYTYDQTTPTSTSAPQHVAVSGSRGNLTSVAYNNVTGTLTKTISYYDTGNIYQVTDVNGGVKTYTYGACGNAFPTQETLPVTTLAISFAWNCSGGALTQFTDQNGKSANITYSDPYFWRPASMIDPTGATVNYTYPSPNVSEAAMVFNGSSTVDARATLDGLGRTVLTQLKQSPSASSYDTVETDYDAAGRPFRVSLPYSAPAGQSCPACPGVTRTSDALGRVLQVSDAGGGVTSYSYSANDVLITEGPAAPGEHVKARQIEYDGFGRIQSVCEISTYYGSGSCGQTTQATGFPTSYSYTNRAYQIFQGYNGNSTGPQNPFGYSQGRLYQYDLLGRVLSHSIPEASGTNSQNVFDADSGSSACPGTYKGDVVRQVDALGNTFCYTYDMMRRPLSVTYSGPYAANTPNKYFVYDAATVNGSSMANAKGRLAEAFTATCQTCSKITDIGLGYSVRGELSDLYESTPHSGPYYHINALYWANGAVSQVGGVPGLPTFSFTPDGEGRLSVVSASASQNPVLGTVYNAASEPLSVSLGSGDSDAFTYDPATARMTQYTYNVHNLSTTGSLTWNPNGSLQNLNISDAYNSTNTQSCAYLYDDMHRVCSASCGPAWNQTFAYDQFGNISKSGSISFQPIYNPANNHITSVGSSSATYDGDGNVLNDTVHTYAWDAESKPVSVDGVSLIFDALGRMVEQGRSGIYSQIVYTPSGGKLAIMGGQSLQKAFLPLPGGATAVYNSTGLLWYYRHPDWQGSSRLASTSTQGFYSSTAYAPFGEPYAQAGTPDPSFTGKNQDTVPNLYDFPAREYSFQGRWSSPDPFQGSMDPTNPQSLNRYAYAMNDPLNRTDSSGLDDDCLVLSSDVGSASDCPGGGDPCDGDPTCGGANPCGADPSCGIGSPVGCDTVVDPACGGVGGVGIVVGSRGNGGGGMIFVTQAPTPDLNNIACNGPCLDDDAKFILGRVGQETGWLDPSGLRRPGETFNKCMVRHAKDFSLAGVFDSIAGTHVADTFVGNVIGGNTFADAYSDVVSSDWAGLDGDLTEDATEEGSERALLGAIKQPLSYGRRTSDLLSLNLAGKRGLPRALEWSSKGAKDILETATDIFDGKDLVDLALLGAEALNCSSE